MRSTILASMALAGLAGAGVKSGHAEAELVAASAGYTAGKPVELAIRLRMDEGWHSYWVNPGEGGMPLSVEWQLPEGWVAGPVLHPVPIRFMTGELPGFGYEGEVLLPVFLTPAADAAGAVTIGAQLDWLTCDDEACVPGSAEVSIELRQGVEGPGKDAAAIRDALAAVPQPLEGAKLELAEVDGGLSFRVELPGEASAEGAELFPATPGVVDHSKPIRLSRDGKGWVGTVPLNEYASDAPEQFEAVLAGGELEKPLLLKWRRGG